MFPDEVGFYGLGLDSYNSQTNLCTYVSDDDKEQTVNMCNPTIFKLSEQPL